MRIDEGEPEHHGVNLGQNVADGPKIPEGFAHLFTVDVDETVVEPVMDNRRMPGVTLTLTDLGFVMRETEVVATAVDVELFSEVVHRHGRALNVPSRPSRAPRRVPCRFAGLG